VAMLFLFKELNLQKEDTVILSAYSDDTLFSLLKQENITPVICDVDKKTGVIDFSLLKEIKTPVKAIFTDVPFFWDEQINSFSEEIPLILNMTNQFGESWPPQIGDSKKKIIYTVNYKNNAFIDTCGNGCSVFTNSLYFSKKWENIFENQSPFKDLFITNLQAVVGLEQLKKCDNFLITRQNIAKEYDEVFKDQAFITPNTKIPYLFYPVKVENQHIDSLKDIFKNHGIQVKNFHEQSLLSSLTLKELYPRALYLENHLLCFPIYPTLKALQIKKILLLASRVF
jgi:hypothetical protein